jgi:uncharacterized protein (TIGR00290 family)
MKFAASYSGGKESALALHRATRQGHTPVLLITTFNVDKNHSYFHGINEAILNRVSDSLGIPSLLVKTKDDDYTQNFEKALTHAKALGAQACVFGDIDIEEHRNWCSERCEKVDLEPLFPLWGESRKSIVYEFIDSGFIANISVVNTKYLNDSFLGQQLTRETANRISGEGADICGENGEYHTFVSAGPIFRQPVRFSLGEKIIKNEYALRLVQSD